MAYAIRCALRAEPLYADQNSDPLRARFVRDCIEKATNYFTSGQFENASASVEFAPSFADYGVQAAQFTVMAAEAAFNEDNDPDYDSEEAEDDEATPAHRIESVASFSLLAVYDTHSPLDEARRCERIAFAVTLADFKWLMENHNMHNTTDMGPLWQRETLDTFADRVKQHEKMLAD